MILSHSVYQSKLGLRALGKVTPRWVEQLKETDGTFA